MEEKLPHKLQLSERNKLTMTGVTEVASFEENSVVLHTALGRLLVQGRELKL
jgi:sporulation protein YabP